MCVLRHPNVVIMLTPGLNPRFEDESESRFPQADR